VIFQRGAFRLTLARIELGRDRLHQRLGGEHIELHVGQQRLHQLEIGDALAELLALHRIAERHAISRSHMPSATAAMWMRPRSSTFIAVLKPPGYAADDVGGRHGIVQDHVGGDRPLLAHLLVGLAEADAGVPAGRMKAEMPPAPGTSGSVRAISVKTEARGALVMKRLVPVMR
jgi:hypothetical protein